MKPPACRALLIKYPTDLWGKDYLKFPEASRCSISIESIPEIPQTAKYLPKDVIVPLGSGYG